MTKKILLFVVFATPGLAGADVWKSTSKDLPELLAEGYEIVGFDVDNSIEALEPTKFRYVLQLKTDEGNKAALCSETDRGSRHECWVTKD